MNASRFVPLPFDGDHASPAGGYALDDSGRAGAALAEARRVALADRRRRIDAWMACAPVQLTIGQTGTASARGGK